MWIVVDIKKSKNGKCHHKVILKVGKYILLGLTTEFLNIYLLCSFPFSIRWLRDICVEDTIENA